MKFKEKIPLDKFSHTVRAAHLINQYGVGAMVNFKDQVLMTAAPETWQAGVVPIFDERLQKKLDVDYFGLPVNQDDNHKSGTMAYVRFPQWYSCPECHKFMPMKEWVKLYRKNAPKKNLQNDPYMIVEPHCPICSMGRKRKVHLVAARLVTVCEHGHINDFPWIDWAHVHEDGRCDNPQLKLNVRRTGTYGFRNIEVECMTCHAKADLGGVMEKNLFKNHDEGRSKKWFKCQGTHPWKNVKEGCDAYPRAVLRGASSVYYPVEESSLVIPPYETEFKKNVRNTVAFRHGLKNVEETRTDEYMSSEEKAQDIRKYIRRTTGDVVRELGSIVKEDDVMEYLEGLWGEKRSCDSVDITIEEENRRYREEEYDALTGEAKGAEKEGRSDFVREEISVCKERLPFLSQVVLLHKLREVRALVGFSRVNPVMDRNDQGHFVSIKEEKTRFYPGYQVFGEGIFLRFDSRQIALWESEYESELTRREKLINDHFHESFFGRGSSRQITVKGILLHSFAHALIRQLSFECGYGISSLRERLYYDQEDGIGKDMAGILIYTASGDSEGTMGGLVRQGYMESLPDIIKKAIDATRHCSNDPVCSLSHGQGNFAMNLAACHTCLLLPETSCEEFNSFLDRAMLIGTMENPEIGFFSKGYDTYKMGKDVVPRKSTPKGSTAQNDSEGVRADDEVENEPIEQHRLQSIKKGALYDGDDPDKVWKNLLEDCEDEEDDDGIKAFNDLIARHMRIIPRSYYAGKMKDCETGQVFEFNQCFRDKQLLLFTKANESDYDIAKHTGWHCYMTGPDFDMEGFIRNLEENE